VNVGSLIVAVPLLGCPACHRSGGSATSWNDEVAAVVAHLRELDSATEVTTASG
jgi:hypothetical protein